VVLNVGVVTPNKRQVEILEVARALHEQGLRLEVHFIGSAHPKSVYAAAFLKRIRVAEQKGYARYLGTKSTTELIQCFDEASALVHFPIAEAFGLVVAEALARNLKVFGARVGGIPDIAEGLPGTELFGEQDWTGLGTAIAQWIRIGYPRPTQSAHQIAARYHPKVIAQRHLEIYEELLTISE
jgi:glycosyltransferase involved in cell wall biosynthesis